MFVGSIAINVLCAFHTVSAVALLVVVLTRSAACSRNQQRQYLMRRVADGSATFCSRRKYMRPNQMSTTRMADSAVAPPSRMSVGRLDVVRNVQQQGELKSVSHDDAKRNDTFMPDATSRSGVVDRRTVLTGTSVIAATLSGRTGAAWASQGAFTAEGAAKTGGTLQSGIKEAAAVASGTASAADSPMNQLVSGLLSGSAVSTTKQVVLYPLDTIKTRLQVKGTRRDLFRNLYDGILPPLLSSTPSGAVFFGTKDFVKAALKPSMPESKVLITLIAVGVGQIPYWLVRSPSEILKTRRQAEEVGVMEGMLEEKSDALKLLQGVIEEEGWRGLYKGYGSNVAYAFPADAIKFLVFEALQRKVIAQGGRAKLSPVESAVYGSIASCVSQAATAPLDVIRTRIMAQRLGRDNYLGIVDCFERLLEEEGPEVFFAGITPKLGRAVLSGAIQFSSYEMTKQALSENNAGSQRSADMTVPVSLPVNSRP